MTSFSLENLPAVVFITGTDTDIGKTMTTAALAAALSSLGRRVAVYKPAQTGVIGNEPGDAGEVARLSGIDAVFEGIRLTEPMAPVAAAAIDGVSLPDISVHVERIIQLAGEYQHVLVEGAGGLLVELDGGGQTMADLASLLASGSASSDDLELSSGLLLVARSALGTLNHVALTLEVLDARGISVTGLVVGSWPQNPTAIELSNRDYFAALPVPVLAQIPEAASVLEPTLFQSQVLGWFTS